MVFADGERFTAHVYGTQLLNDCPEELWNTLVPEAIAEDLGALAVKLNGPRIGCWTALDQRANR